MHISETHGREKKGNEEGQQKRGREDARGEVW